MVIIKEEDKEVKLKLKQSEISEIVECLETQPHNVYKFFRHNKLIKKLKDSENVDYEN